MQIIYLLQSLSQHLLFMQLTYPYVRDCVHQHEYIYIVTNAGLVYMLASVCFGLVRHKCLYCQYLIIFCGNIHDTQCIHIVDIVVTHLSVGCRSFSFLGISQQCLSVIDAKMFATELFLCFPMTSYFLEILFCYYRYK